MNEAHGGGPVVAMPEILAARERRCYLEDGRAPRTDQDAADLVTQRRFMTLGVVARTNMLPSLSGADPDREWNVSWLAWRWKQTLPAARACAYLKWFHNQGTFIAWNIYPSFYALWGPGLARRGAAAYRSGLLNPHEREVLEVIERDGPISSRELWQELKPQFGGKRRLMLAALTGLQKGFYVTVSGGELDRWSMHYWDTVRRVVPAAVLRQTPSLETARAELIAAAVDNLACCTPREVAGLFGWRPSEVRPIAAQLAEQGRIRDGVRVERQKEGFLAALDFAPAGRSGV